MKRGRERKSGWKLWHGGLALAALALCGDKACTAEEGKLQKWLRENHWVVERSSGPPFSGFQLLLGGGKVFVTAHQAVALRQSCQPGSFASNARARRPNQPQRFLLKVEPNSGADCSVEFGVVLAHGRAEAPALTLHEGGISALTAERIVIFWQSSERNGAVECVINGFPRARSPSALTFYQLECPLARELGPSAIGAPAVVARTGSVVGIVTGLGRNESNGGQRLLVAPLRQQGGELRFGALPVPGR